MVRKLKENGRVAYQYLEDFTRFGSGLYRAES
jgi:hypothetical protein